MGTLLMVSLLALSTATLAQQQQPQQEKQQPQAQSAEEQAKQKELQERLRADGAAGGTAPVPEEKRSAVNAGAGPHRSHDAPSAERLPADEPIKPGS